MQSVLHHMLPWASASGRSSSLPRRIQAFTDLSPQIAPVLTRHSQSPFPLQSLQCLPRGSQGHGTAHDTAAILVCTEKPRHAARALGELLNRTIPRA